MWELDRTILHVDMNAFYASVETLSHPDALTRPMAVCGDVESRHGIILAKNELAKRCGVQTAEPVWQAQRKCPGLLLLPPHRELYFQYSKMANQIYQRYTDLVEAASIDESYLDVTGSRALFGEGKTIADRIRREVKEELGLTASAGVSFCKIFAKLGSDYKKPDATTVISRDNYPQILYPLTITALMSVGSATAGRLRDVGVETLGDLAAMSEAALRSLLGKQGATLYRYVHGLDAEPVRGPDNREEAKSIGNSLTYRRNLVTLEDIRAGVLPLAETVGARLRKRRLKCLGVQVQIKDPDFRMIDRQTRFSRPTHLNRDLFETAMVLIAQNWKTGKPIRLISVTAIGLVPEDAAVQLDLFSEAKDESKLEALDSTLDQLRLKYGNGALKPASILKNDLGI